jgi:hypothetical protein
MKDYALKFDYLTLTNIHRFISDDVEDILDSSSTSSIIRNIIEDVEGALYLDIVGSFNSSEYTIKVYYGSDINNFQSFHYKTVYSGAALSDEEMRELANKIYLSIGIIAKKEMKRRKVLANMLSFIENQIYSNFYVQKVEIPSEEESDDED